jgi:hypothetical protein
MKRLVLATTVAVASVLGSIPTTSAAGRWNTSELGLKSCGTWTQNRQDVEQATIDGNGSWGSLAE